MADIDVKDPTVTAISEPTGQPTLNLRQAHLAYARVKAELDAISDDDFSAINFDVIAVIHRVLGSVAKIQAKRSLLEKVQPFEIRWVDKLEDYALAFGHTQSVVQSAEESLTGEEVEFLLENRRLLQEEGRILAKRKRMDPLKLSKFSHTNNHTELGHDVLGLTNLYLSSWDKLNGRCGATKEELESLRERANSYILSLSNKGNQTTSLSQALVDRQRAATLMLLAYRKIRVGLMLMLDSQKKVDEIAAPLGKRRAKKGKGGDASDDSANEDMEAGELGEGNDSGDETEDEVDSESESEQLAASAANAGDVTPAAPARRSDKAAVRVGMPGSPPTQEDDDE